MNVKKLSQSGTGKLVKVPQGYWAFVPNPLPPAIDFSPQVSQRSLRSRPRRWGRWRGWVEHFPIPTLLVMPYARREAVLSSRIEGTQASLSDLFLFEAAKVKSEDSDVKEVSNYVRAMNHGLKRLNESAFELTARAGNACQATGRCSRPGTDSGRISPQPKLGRPRGNSA